VTESFRHIGTIAGGRAAEPLQWPLEDPACSGPTRFMPAEMSAADAIGRLWTSCRQSADQLAVGCHCALAASDP
jgi:hypothetical protein